MNAKELYESGQLSAAITAALDEVKKDPSDTAKRSFLCELLCFTDNLERADKQLDVLATQDADAMIGITLFRQLIRAEQSRRQFHQDGRVPEFLDLPNPVQKLHLEASILIRDGQPAEAMQLLNQAEEQRPKLRGTCDGKAFDDFRDLDDLTAAFFEVLTSNGKYYWIPFEQVESIEIHPPAHVRDLIWTRVHMVVREGPDGEVYLPILYAASSAEEDDQIRLGRATDWQGDEGEPVRGLGQRTFLIGEEDRPILSVKEIQFEQE